VTPAEAVMTYGAAWAEPDEAKRRALLEKAWAENGTYLDPTGRADGREALVAHIAGFQQVFTGHRIDITSGVDEHDGYIRFAWKIFGPDGSAVSEGVDFGELDDDGKIRSIVGFFGPWPELT
jgi:hypothetical protein